MRDVRRTALSACGTLVLLRMLRSNYLHRACRKRRSSTGTLLTAHAPRRSLPEVTHMRLTHALAPCRAESPQNIKVRYGAACALWALLQRRLAGQLVQRCVR